MASSAAAFLYIRQVTDTFVLQGFKYWQKRAKKVAQDNAQVLIGEDRHSDLKLEFGHPLKILHFIVGHNCHQFIARFCSLCISFNDLVTFMLTDSQKGGSTEGEEARIAAAGGRSHLSVSSSSVCFSLRDLTCSSKPLASICM